MLSADRFLVAGEDFDKDLQIPNIDFAVYVRMSCSVQAKRNNTTCLAHVSAKLVSTAGKLRSASQFVRFVHTNLILQIFPGSNFSMEDWGLGWIQDHANGSYHEPSSG